MKRHHGAILAKVALFLTIAIAGFGQAVHQLWNWLMPGIFGLPVIGFWQSVGLLALSWLLFGGWRGFRGPGPGARIKWRRKLLDRWERMTPEERLRFREGLSGRRGPQRDPQQAV